MKIKFRKFKKTDTKEVALLIKNTFGKFCNKEYFRKLSIREYLNRYDPKKNTIQQLYENFRRTPIFYVAIKKNKIIGMIRGKSERISNLFVDGKQHRKGIGRILVSKFELEAKKQKSKEIKIRSSLYAAPFYQKIGYRKTTGVRNFHGLKVYPMKKYLN